MKYLVMLTGACLLAACATTGSQTQASAGAIQVASAEDIEEAQREGYDPNAIRCQREQVIGSRLAARQVCRPEWEWRAIQRSAQETGEHLQRLPTPCDSETGC